MMSKSKATDKIRIITLLFYLNTCEKPRSLENLYCLTICIKVMFLGHLRHSGDLLLWVAVRRRPSGVVY